MLSGLLLLTAVCRVAGFGSFPPEQGSVKGCYHMSTTHTVDCEKDGTVTEATCPAEDMWITESTSCGYVDPAIASSIAGCYSGAPTHAVTCEKDGATEATCMTPETWLPESTSCGAPDPDAPAAPCVEGQRIPRRPTLAPTLAPANLHPCPVPPPPTLPPPSAPPLSFHPRRHPNHFQVPVATIWGIHTPAIARLTPMATASTLISPKRRAPHPG